MIFDGLFGNTSTSKILLYLETFSSGYPRAISSSLSLSLSQVQRQLERLEAEGILSSRLVGKTRLYNWNPRCGYLEELRKLLSSGLKMIPLEVKKEMFSERRRPRRAGKSLP